MKYNMETPTLTLDLEEKWLKSLWKRLSSIRRKRLNELNELNKIVFTDPLSVAKFYVEPDCQEMNPADREEDDFLVSKEPIFKKVDQFFRSTSASPGGKQLFILSDAGMGKTAFLTMLKLLHITRFWPSKYNCYLLKLGPTTIQEIASIKDARNTILLLDSLDEDPCAYGRVKNRLIELLKATEHFHRVITTCRTQFFPKVDSDPMERPGLVVIGGYICPTKYLAFFDDPKIRKYLQKRFPNKWIFFKQKKEIQAAFHLIKSMGTLRCRPMLLAHIEDLMASPAGSDSLTIFGVYNALTTVWLLREQTKHDVSAKELRAACEILATELQMQHARSIPESALDEMMSRNPKLNGIKSIDIKGRSLLNRNSDGDYRFSHYSIQEYLVVCRLLADKRWSPSKKVPCTTMMVEMLNSFRDGRTKWKLLDLKGVNLARMNFSEGDLCGADLAGSILSGKNLSKTNLADANLEGADLSGCTGDRPKFRRAILRNAIFDGAKFTGADFTGANLDGASFVNSTCMPCEVIDGVYASSVTRFDFASMRKTVLANAKLDFSIFKNADLTEADFTNAELKSVDMTGATIADARITEFQMKGIITNNERHS